MAHRHCCSVTTKPFFEIWKSPPELQFESELRCCCTCERKALFLWCFCDIIVYLKISKFNLNFGHSFFLVYVQDANS